MKLSAWQRHDTKLGMTVASVHIEGKSKHWPDLNCQPCVHVEICDWCAKLWQADCYLELADFDRTQWSVCRNFDTREEAAAEAAAFVATAKGLLQRSLNGEAVSTPRHKREEAAQRAWSQSAELVAVEHELSVAREAFDSAKTKPVRRVMREEVRAAEKDKFEVAEVFVNRFHAAHHWSEFTSEVSP